MNAATKSAHVIECIQMWYLSLQRRMLTKPTYKCCNKPVQTAEITILFLGVNYGINKNYN